jgi:hypothetical protein
MNDGGEDVTTAAGYELPLPRLRGLVAEWYGWLKRHELRFQRCAGCERWRHVPREVCPGCGSTDWSWRPSSGRGTVYTWTTTYRSLHPSWVQTPFAQVVVELEEGPRVMTSVVDRTPDELRIGMAVEVVFDDVTPEVTLAKFRSRPG